MSQVELLQRAWLKIVMAVILFQIWKYISRWQATEGYWLQNKTEQWKITEIPKSNSNICWELKPSRSNSKIGLDNYSVKVEWRLVGPLCPPQSTGARAHCVAYLWKKMKKWWLSEIRSMDLTYKMEKESIKTTKVR